MAYPFLPECSRHTCEIPFSQITLSIDTCERYTIPHRRHLKPFNASAPAVKLHHIWNLPLAITANNRGSYGISWSFHICHSQRDVETT